MTRRESRTTRAYRRLLRLYPRAFRERFGDEMLAFVEAQSRMPRYRGAGVVCLWARLAMDLTRAAPRSRLDALRDRRERKNEAAHVGWASQTHPEEEVVETLAQDIRYALRTLAKRPSFTLVAALTLALGIGATTAIFSAVSAVLLRPLPYPDGDRLVALWASSGGRTTERLLASYPDVMDWRGRSKTFEEIGIMRSQSVNLTGGDRPDRLIGSFATPGVFRVLGATTALGRTFNDSEATPGRGARVAVVSHTVWRERFGRDRSILGRTLILNGVPHAVIGVLAPSFQSPFGPDEVWMPITSIPSSSTFDRGVSNVWAIGKLRPTSSVDAARRELGAISAQLASEFPNTNRGVGAIVVPMREQVVGPMGAALLTVFAAVGLVLLIACANVANLQLARAASRRHEIALRAALGAARWRIVRQLLTESALLSFAGGTLGVLFAKWAIGVLVTLVPGGLPAFGDVGLDRNALLFAAIASAVSAVLFGLAPALRAARSDLRDTLNARSAVPTAGRRFGAGTAVMAAQLALCTMLLITAGLLGRSLGRLRTVDPGFNPNNVLSAEFRLPAVKYKDDASRAEFFRRLIPALRAIPGAKSAALVGAVPLSGNWSGSGYTIEGRPAPQPGAESRVQYNTTSDAFFRTMEIPLLAGRDFDARDVRGSPPVAIVNQTLARREWPKESPIGKRLRAAGDSTWMTVVGVAGDVKHLTLADPPTAQLYMPMLQSPNIFSSVVVRAEGEPAALTAALRNAIWSIDRDQPVWKIRPISALVDFSTRQQRFTLMITAAFAGIALLLGAIGVYGVMSYAVVQRTREMGIRIAIGARQTQVVAMVVRRTLAVALAAAGLGVAGALATTGLLATQLFGVAPRDPLTFALVPLLLSSVAALAAYLPARRASRVDPMVALRAE